MLQPAAGLLTIVGANTPTPSVYWRGQPLVVLSIVAVGNIAMFRVARGLYSPALLADLADHGIKLKEVIV